MYVLDAKLQSGKPLPKWRSQAQMGVYLGVSPNHTHSIALILNPHTEHVSPQFHSKHDDFFKMVTDKVTDFDHPTPEWMYLSNL